MKNEYEAEPIPQADIQYIIYKDGMFLCNDKHSVENTDFFVQDFDAPFVLKFREIRPACHLARQHNAILRMLIDGVLH
jgi:hypothetical protein